MVMIDPGFASFSAPHSISPYWGDGTLYARFYTQTSGLYCSTSILICLIKKFILFWLANETIERFHKTFAEKNGLICRLSPHVYEDSYARARGSFFSSVLLKVLLLNFSVIFPARSSGFVIQSVCTVVGIKARND